MRFRTLQLLRFGPFSDRTLELAEGDRGFHVLHGPNEAGKSTALRAITALLYEFPVRTSDAWIHTMSDLRVAAEIEAADGRRLAFQRRKGRKDTLLDPMGTVLPESALQAFLGGVSEPVFEQMFGLDHDRLVRGGRDLLAGEGEIGSALFGAAAGLRGVRQLADQLAAEASAIFKKTGSTPSLNRALKEHADARKRVKAAVLKPTEWERVETAVVEASREQALLDAKLGEALEARSVLEVLRAALPDLRGRAGMQERLPELGDVPLLASDARERRLEAQKILQDTALRVQKLNDERDDLQRELASSAVPQPLLAVAEGVKGLTLRAGAEKKAVTDRRLLVDRVETSAAQLESRLADLPGAPSLAELEARSIGLELRGRIRRLARDGGALQTRRAQLLSEETQARRELDEARKELEELPPLAESTGLRAAVEAARAEGPVEAQRDERQAELDRARAAAKAALEALPLWRGTLEEGVALRLPSDATVDAFERRFERLREEQNGLERDARSQRDALVEVEAALEEDAGIVALPEATDLEVARTRRQELWGRVQSNWLAGEASEEPPAVLAKTFEAAVDGADATADRLLAGHERVARREELRNRRERHRSALIRLDEAVKELAGRQSALGEEWETSWAEAGIEPRSPHEMKAWKGQHARLCERVEAVADLEGRVASVDRMIARLDESCREALGAAGAALPELTGLNPVLFVADEMLARLERARREREDVEAKVARCEQAHERRRADLAAGEEEWTQWKMDWGEAVSALGVDASSDPREVEEVLERVEAILKQAAELASQRRRIEHIDQEASEFEASVAELLRKAQLALDADSAVERAGLLEDRLREGLAARERWNHCQARVAAIDAELRDLGRDREAAEKRLAELVEAAGVDDVGALDAAERRSAEKLELTRKLAETEERLGRLSLPLDELVRQAETVEESELVGRMESLDQKIREQKQALDEATQNLVERKRDRRELDGSEAAARAQDEAEQALARIAQLAEEYAEKRIAERLLVLEMQRFSQQNQDPILRRSDELFRRMTLDRYTGLESGFGDDDQPVLRCARAGGGAVGVEALSDGTRDQLYLSLRLAALEHHASRSEPLPFIVDDILLTFDDPRAAVTLEILGEISDRIQILFFTHHARLVELARSVVPSEKLAVHDFCSESVVAPGASSRE